jgi:hypothetical protein
VNRKRVERIWRREGLSVDLRTEGLGCEFGSNDDPSPRHRKQVFLMLFQPHAGVIRIAKRALKIQLFAINMAS